MVQGKRPLSSSFGRRMGILDSAIRTWHYSWRTLRRSWTRASLLLVLVLFMLMLLASRSWLTGDFCPKITEYTPRSVQKNHLILPSIKLHDPMTTKHCYIVPSWRNPDEHAISWRYRKALLPSPPTSSCLSGPARNPIRRGAPARI